MSHINPQLPADGQQNWAATADSYLTTLTNQINLHDDQIANIIANGGGTGSGANTIVDNGDGTITILPTGSSTGGGSTGTNSIALDTDGVPYLVL